MNSLFGAIVHGGACGETRRSMGLLNIIGDVSLELGLQLKDKQVEAIQKFCEGFDVFVSLPTGFGKSMSFGNNF